MVGDHRVWMGVVVRGGVLSLMDGGWLFVVIWGHRPCGAWSSIGGRYRLCVRRGHPWRDRCCPWGVVVVRAWGVVVC